MWQLLNVAVCCWVVCWLVLVVDFLFVPLLDDIFPQSRHDIWCVNFISVWVVRVGLGWLCFLIFFIGVMLICAPVITAADDAKDLTSNYYRHLNLLQVLKKVTGIYILFYMCNTVRMIYIYIYYFIRVILLMCTNLGQHTGHKICIIVASAV